MNAFQCFQPQPIPEVAFSIDVLENNLGVCKGCPEKVFLLCLQGITGCLKKYCEIEINTRLKIVREFNAQTKKNFVLVISGLKGGQNIYVFFKTQKGSRG